MAENAYTSLVQRAYRDFALGDLDLIRTVMADDVVWHEPGRSPLSGDYKGPAQVLEFLRMLQTRSDGTFRAEIVDVLSEPERAVVFQRSTAMRGDRTLDSLAVLDFEVHHQRITEVTVYHADCYAFDDFWVD